MPDYYRDPQRTPTAKRSPSILVTDVRNQPSKRSTAPFAGAAQTNKFAQRPYRSRSSNEKMKPSRGTKFSNISVSNILSNASEIPSALRRLPPHQLFNEDSEGILPQYQQPSVVSGGHAISNNNLNTSIGHSTSGYTSGRRKGSFGSGLSNRRAASRGVTQDRAPLPKLIQPLPPRTSKTSQKLVYIPDEGDDDNGDEAKFPPDFQQTEKLPPALTGEKALQHKWSTGESTSPRISASKKTPVFSYQRASALLKKIGPVIQSKKTYRKAKAESKKLNKSKEQLPRVTAYFIADAIDLEKAAAFLRKVHKASARLYDEVLYVPYQLPLLDGSNGYRVRSNIYSKNAVGKANVEDKIDKSEQRDYHFEYYSGQENEELLKAKNDNNQPIINPQDVAIQNSDESQKSTDTMHENEEQQQEEEQQERASNSNNGSVKSDSNDNNYASDFKSNDEDNFDPYEPQYFNYKEPSTPNTETVSISQVNHAEVFLFNYGVIVFWNFTKSQEENLLADLSFSRYSDEDEDDILIREIKEQDIETEEFHFEYDKTTNIPRIYNDIIILKSDDHLIKMTISHAIAQSTKLCRFESRMSEVLYAVSKLPKILALTGQLGINREQLLKKSGKLFKLRVDVNLSSNVLDTPEFFWSFEPSLNPLYTAARDYLEIDERVEVINDRCKVFLEFTDVIADSIAETNMNKITWIIIVIIVISLCVSCLEIFVRYKILNKNN